MKVTGTVRATVRVRVRVKVRVTGEGTEVREGWI